MTEFGVENPRPVFLHGLWRSGSTYVWSKFRSSKDAYSYFEQLYSGLAKLTTQRLSYAPWRETVSANHHPQLEEPYFAEFSPLLARRGVKGFRRSFAFDRFVLGERDDHGALQSYLQSLIDFAHQLGRRPVLGCNRTWLRAGWIQAKFSPYSVHVERDPLAIWGSYMRHAKEGNYNYFTNLHLILERNANHPLFAPMAQRVRLRRGCERICKAIHFYPALVDAMSTEESYALVFYMWSLSILSGLSHCDLILDTASPERATLATQAVKAGCGLDVDFSDLRPLDAAPAPSLRVREVERSVRALLPAAAIAQVCAPSAIRRRMRQLSVAKADTVFPLLKTLTASRLPPTSQASAPPTPRFA